MGDFGIRISKKGYDVKLDDDKNLALTSKYPNFKGAVTGNGTVLLTSTVDRTVTIAHNYGYIPICRAYVDNLYYAGSDWSGQYAQIPNSDGYSPVEYASHSLEINDTNLVLTMNYTHEGHPTDTRTFGYIYFIYKDKGKV